MSTSRRNKKQQKNASAVVQSLVIKPSSRRPWDIRDWTSALRSADRGMVNTLYDLYEDMLIDGVLSDSVDKRIDAVLNSNIIFVDKKG